MCSEQATKKRRNQQSPNHLIQPKKAPGAHRIVMPAGKRIPMAKRETVQQRCVSFCKRRSGLYNKMAELSLIADARLGVLVSSPCSNRKFYCFGSPSADVVFDCFLNNRVPEDMLESNVDKQSAVRLYNEIKALELQVEDNTVKRKKRKFASSSSATATGLLLEIEELVNSSPVEQQQEIIEKLEKYLKGRTFVENTGSVSEPSTSANDDDYSDNIGHDDSDDNDFPTSSAAVENMESVNEPTAANVDCWRISPNIAALDESLTNISVDDYLLPNSDSSCNGDEFVFLSTNPERNNNGFGSVSSATPNNIIGVDTVGDRTLPTCGS